MRILIDGGGFRATDFDIGQSVLTPILLSKKILTLDFVINTHPHGDHLGGIPTVIRDFTVKNFATGFYFLGQEQFVDLLKLLKQRKVPVAIWKQGDTFLFKNGMSIKVLHPGPDTGTDDLNNASLVIKIQVRNLSILFPGDIGFPVEEKLVEEGENLTADVLKIPHHGSRYSSSYAFLAAVRPSLAVLSVGKGLPGIPSEEALKRYDERSTPVLRTDRDGMVQIRENKEGFVAITGVR